MFSKPASLPALDTDALTSLATQLQELQADLLNTAKYNLIYLNDIATGCSEEIDFVLINFWLIFAPENAIGQMPRYLTSGPAIKYQLNENEMPALEQKLAAIVSSPEQLYRVLFNVDYYLESVGGQKKFLEEQRAQSVRSYPLNNFWDADVKNAISHFDNIQATVTATKTKLINYFAAIIAHNRDAIPSDIVKLNFTPFSATDMKRIANIKKTHEAILATLQQTQKLSLSLRPAN